MTNKGSSRHMTGLAAPRFFGIRRKEHKYIAKPAPGRHTEERCVTLLLALKKAGVADSSAEASRLIKNGSAQVNSKTVREPTYPVGLGDILAVAGHKGAFQIFVNQYAKVDITEVEKPDYDSQLFRINGKYKTRKGATMIRLHDGATVQSKNDVHVNDSVVVDLKNNVKKVLPFEVGAACTIISGVHVGAAGKIKAIKKGSMRMPSSVVVAPKQGEEFETLVKNVMITQ